MTASDVVSLGLQKTAQSVDIAALRWSHPAAGKPRCGARVHGFMVRHQHWGHLQTERQHDSTGPANGDHTGWLQTAPYADASRPPSHRHARGKST